MAYAEYRIAIPTTDEHGNPLHDLASLAHQHLTYGPAKVEAAWVEPGKKGGFRADPHNVYDHLIAVAEDTPHSDSHMKQLGAHVAEVANHWGAHVTKRGTKGLSPWQVRNPMYRPGEPAEQLAHKLNNGNRLDQNQ